MMIKERKFGTANAVMLMAFVMLRNEAFDG
jgi:hypothetical protein